MKPVIAIVGRPNVGKSTLLNRLIGRTAAVVADTPGVTRDRIFAECNLAGRTVILVDTGGFDPAPQDELGMAAVEQTRLAIEDADLILFVCDAKDGLNPIDQTMADLLRRSNKPTVCAVNKSDPGAAWRQEGEFHRLGLDLLPISAAHGTGLAEMAQWVADRLPSRPAKEKAPRVQLRLCLLGRPNVGKSSLANQLAGQRRQVVSTVPGTTRDAVDILLTRGGVTCLLVDTPGVRRKRSITLELEKMSVLAALRSLERADVAVVVLDATEPFADQDARLLRLVHDRGRGLVVAVNKTDLWRPQDRQEYLRDLRLGMRFVAYASAVSVSALTGEGVDRLLAEAVRASESTGFRIPTSELNRFMQEAVSRLQPPHGPAKAGQDLLHHPGLRPPSYLRGLGQRSHPGSQELPEIHREQAPEAVPLSGGTVALGVQEAPE